MVSQSRKSLARLGAKSLASRETLKTRDSSHTRCTFLAFFISREMRENWPISREKMREMRGKLCTINVLNLITYFHQIIFENMAVYKCCWNLGKFNQMTMLKEFLNNTYWLSLNIPQNLVKFGSKLAKSSPFFFAISRSRISREKYLAKPFLVLARNARNVHVY